MKRVLVTGGSGLVGSALKDIGFDAVYLSSVDCDLRDYESTLRTFRKYNPDLVIHLAGKVGGVKANDEMPATFFEDNISINTNVLKASRICKVGKVVSALSTCIYPDRVSYPLREEYLHDGPPHDTNFAYAYAKRMIEVQGRAYRKQYDLNYVSFVPTNVYGPNDNFHPEDSHVIPGLLRKAIISEKAKKDYLEIWGSGKPLRDFIYSRDLARLIVKVAQSYDDPEPIILATGENHSIYDIAKKICSYFDGLNYIKNDPSKPDGQLKKPVDITKLKLLWPDFEFTSIDKGLEETVVWLRSNYKNARGFNF